MAAISPDILPLERGDAPGAGGKAAGLARLVRLGLRVPDGFVIAGARPGVLPEGIDEAYRALGEGPVAVRSSALDEDGAEHSFAGQYRTELDIEGLEELRSAVDRCLAAAAAERVAAYREGLQDGAVEGVESIGIVVQRMVPARAAGVLFTADPVSGRRDRVVVDAVTGQGEALVSGHARPDHYLVDRSGRAVERDLVGDRPLLVDAELARLVSHALHAEQAAGRPMDLEWALDKDGELHWLQARPITTLGADPAEFDTPTRPDHVYTRANVGEMLPGAVCPLDLSVTAYAIDQGIQDLQVRCGGLAERSDPLMTLGTFSGHLFFNLSAMLPFTAKVGGSSAEALTLAICGRPVPELRASAPAAWPVRLANGLRYLNYVVLAGWRTSSWQRRLRSFRLPAADTPAAQWRAIDDALPKLVETYAVHMQSSSGSGLAVGILQGVIAKGQPPTPEQEAQVARLLAGAGGVESADMVGELEVLVAQIEAQPDAKDRFAGAAPAEALAWLRGPEAGPAGRAFQAFLAHHGHRALVELSLRQPGWEDDPEPLIRSMQAALGGRGRKAHADDQPPPAAGLKMVLGLARLMVRRREASKSLLVAVVHHFKRAYRRLGALCARAGLLPDEDAVFFLTHPELGQLVQGRESGLAATAAARREVFPRQRSLQFPLLCVGAPEPLAPEAGDGQDRLVGNPVSPGRVRGPARVIRSLAEAEQIRPGEILITEVTDVGWSPYFRLIAGLVTEVGSPISHGAVVAREYGLPAVVNLAGATRAFQSGDRVELDGDTGVLRKLQAGSDPNT